MLFVEYKRPLARQLREVEAPKLLFERIVEVNKLPVAAGAEVAPRHVNGEGDIALTLLAQVLVVGDGDGQGSLLRVVNVQGLGKR